MLLNYENEIKYYVLVDGRGCCNRYFETKRCGGNDERNKINKTGLSSDEQRKSNKKEDAVTDLHLAYLVLFVWTILQNDLTYHITAHVNTYGDDRQFYSSVT